MDGKILVAYASTHGSTQEIAEFIANTLREGGLVVDVLPAKSLRTLEGYGGVVLGAPLYIFRLHGDAKRFLARHQKAIAGGLPVAVFAGGPFGEPKAGEVDEIRKSIDKELAAYPWFHPIVVEMVGGRFDPAHLRFPWNLVPAMKNMPPSDLRDWDAIRMWAKSLAGQFAGAHREAAIA